MKENEKTSTPAPTDPGAIEPEGGAPAVPDIIPDTSAEPETSGAAGQASSCVDMPEDDECGFDEFDLTPEEEAKLSRGGSADACGEPDADGAGGGNKKKKRLPGLLGDERVKKYRYLGFSFLVPALTMWLIYIAMGTFPFGNGSVLVLDLNGQYIYYFEQLREIVLHGQSFLYCFGRAVGGEFMGIYAYYLASPFSFLVCLFPKELITEALLVMFLLKTGLCGLTFGIFLQYRTPEKELNRVSVVIFSTIYALTAYAVVQQHNTMWIDNLIFLPLIVMGIERMIKYHRFRLFVISLTLAVMSNFYIGYMMCIFVFVYFFIAYATMDPEERNMSGEKGHFGKSLLRMGGSAALVLSMSCVILWSAYYSLTFGKTTFSNPKWTLDQKFDLLDLISKLFIGSYDTVRPEGLPFVYCGTLVLILLPIYFIIKKIPLREKISVFVMSVFFVLSFTISAVDLVWHGFQRPNWLNYRYSFILCFFMIFAAYRAFMYIKEVEMKTVVTVVGFWVVLLLILQKLDTYTWVDDYETVWLSFAFFAAFLILLRYHMTSTAQDGVALAVASIVILESFVGGLLNLVALGDDVVYSSRTSYRSFVDRVQPIVDMVKDSDSSFYRMEKTLHRKTNDPLALGFRGLSNSTSTLNASTIKLLARLGLSSKSHWSKYLGSTPVVDSLFGIKYLVSEAGTDVSDLYEKKFEYQGDTSKPRLYAYYNPYALPIAYGVSPSLIDYMFTTGTDPETSTDKAESPFVRMNDIVSDMCGGEPTEIFVPVNIDDETDSYCTLSFTTGHKAYTNDSTEPKGRVIYTITAPEDGEIYCFFPSDYIRESDLYLNSRKLSTYYGNETYRIVDLGSHTKGEVMRVELRMTESDKLYIKNDPTYFYYFDEDAFVSAMEELARSPYEIERYTEDSFYGTIDINDGDELVFTTIPYDEGWVIKVDGMNVKPIKVLDSLIAFTVPAGHHTLSMEYRPKCVIYGGIISAAGLVTFAGVCAFDFTRRRSRRSRRKKASASE